MKTKVSSIGLLISHGVSMKISNLETIEILAAFVGAIAGTFLGLIVSVEVIILLLTKFG